MSTRDVWPPTGGDRARIWSIARQLAKQHETTLASSSSSGDRDELREGVRIVDVAGNSVFRRVATGVRFYGRGLPAQTGFFWNPGLARFVRQEAERADIVIGHLIRSLPYVAPLACPTILEMTDCMSRMYDQIEPWPPSAKSIGFLIDKSRVRKAEIQALQTADGVVLVAERDRRYLSQRTGAGDRIEVIPLGVELEREPDGPADGSRIVFFGRLDTQQNIDACSFLAAEVWPRVSSLLPGSRLVVAGANPSARLIRLLRQRGASVLPNPPDMEGVLRSASVSVAPMRLAMGTQTKILESLALAIPVVTTTAGAAGLVGTPGGVTTADDPGAMADAIVRLLQRPDERRRLGAEGFEYVRLHYSMDALREKYCALVDAVLTPAAPPLATDPGRG